ncbi:hypothetical protein HH1059_06690 [Halorhodospira halochloris]|uniref:Uncharacterized protein n=1 Tax=Halorhodospira halochloris TaxID=1052 RepID=A0A2Z6EZD7_HALHR|nr:hypothetical protein HH1059_06690 [Halorhodospira halochloris]
MADAGLLYGQILFDIFDYCLQNNIVTTNAELTNLISDAYKEVRFYGSLQGDY